MKRIVTWISVLLLAAGLLGGCASKTAAREGKPLPQIIVGSDSYPPYVYLDNNGDPIGIDVDIAEDDRAGAHHDVVAQGRVALSAVLARHAEGHALVEQAIIADDGRLADDDAHAVVDHEALADGRGGRDLDAVAAAGEAREQSRQPAHAVLP